MHPKTGQILDADIVMDEGFISGWIRQWDSLIPQAAMENFGTDTLEWLETRPDYDPRIRLADPSKRKEVEYQLAMERAKYKGVNHPAMVTDPTLLGDEQYDGLVHRVSQINGACQHCAVKAMDMAFIRLNPELISSLAQDGRRGKGKGRKKKDDDQTDSTEEVVEVKVQMLDGVPESTSDPCFATSSCEVGHTIGLRHNFKASTIYTLEEINQEDFKVGPCRFGHGLHAGQHQHG